MRAELGIGEHERLMGRLYVAGISEGKRSSAGEPLDADAFVTILE